MVLDVKKKSRILTALRVLLALTFVFRTIYTVESYLNAVTTQLFSVYMSVAVMFVSGIISFGIYFLLSSSSYNIISRSRYFPIGSDGICAANRYDFQIYLAAFVIANNILLGILNCSLYACSILTPLFLLVMPKITGLAFLAGFNLLLYKKFGMGQLKEYFVAMAIPNIVLYIAMGGLI